MLLKTAPNLPHRLMIRPACLPLGYQSSSRSRSSSNVSTRAHAQPASVTGPDSHAGNHKPAAQLAADTDAAAPSAAAAAQAEATWDVPTPGAEEDWQGSKPFTLKDVDWGLTGLLGIILVLSFGAYRLLHHFRVYQHSHRPQPRHTITQVVERPGSGSGSGSSAGTAAAGNTPSSSSSSSQPAAAGTTAAAPQPSSKASKSTKPRSKHDKAPSKSSKSAAAVPQPEGADAAATAAAAAAAAGSLALPDAAAAAAGPAGGSGVFELPQQSGMPGAPQPSPLDASFSSSLLPPSWSASDLAQLDLQALPDLKPPDLPSIQVELPAKAVQPSEVASMARDPSLPSLRERAHIAMRASGAAMEAAQRASAYSAAASSAASRAAEAAEQSAAAAAAVQAALERSAEEAMAAAVKRMNRAVEMVADAESRAAAAAAMATAYQDVAESQATAAAAAADLPAMPPRPGPQGHIANLRKVLHEQMFSVGGVVSDWAAGVWAAIVGALAAVQAAAAAAWAKLVGASTTAAAAGG